MKNVLQRNLTREKPKECIFGASGGTNFVANHDDAFAGSMCVPVCPKKFWLHHCNDPIWWYQKLIPEMSALVDEAAPVECPLKISVSVAAISKICFRHFETVEEGTALWGFTKFTRFCGSFTPLDFFLIKSILGCCKHKFLSSEKLIFKFKEH